MRRTSLVRTMVRLMPVSCGRSLRRLEHQNYSDYTEGFVMPLRRSVLARDSFAGISIVASMYRIPSRNHGEEHGLSPALEARPAAVRAGRAVHPAEQSGATPLEAEHPSYRFALAQTRNSLTMASGWGSAPLACLVC
jgi:hypothetical protein